MALDSSQIITLALQAAKAPNFTSQAGQLLNAILQELAQDYDFDVARGLVSGVFNPGLNGNFGPGQQLFGSGPYNLPADFLRFEPDDVMWFLQGVPYPLTPIDLNEFDRQVQLSGYQSYPLWIATDMSQSPPVFFIYPAPSGAYPFSGHYRRQMADIAAPNTAGTVPWFPNTAYLIRRLAGEMMAITGDSRMNEFLGDEPQYPAGAQAMLRAYLKMKDDSGDRAKTVKLDRRRFGRSFRALPDTKAVGAGF